MKKTLSKLKLPKKQPKVVEAPSGRITTDTLAEHREQVLAGGRRFKYPVQYARHKLVINTIIIAVSALAVLGVVGWWQLYPAQNTSGFMYRVTKVFALPVAKIEGQQVLYSDYLVRYRGSIQYLVERDQVNFSTEDGKRHVDTIKRRELDGVIADAYATKLAKEMNISVSDAELEQFLIERRQLTDGEASEATYNAVIMDYYGWSPDEYRQIMKSKLLLQKVSYALDNHATKQIEAIDSLKSAGDSDLRVISEKMNAANPQSVNYSAPIWVPRDNHDGGLAKTAASLKKGEISAPVKVAQGTGYYFVKLVDSSSSQVQYELLHVPLTIFTKQLEEIKKQGKVSEYISIPRIEDAV